MWMPSSPRFSRKNKRSNWIRCGRDWAAVVGRVGPAIARGVAVLAGTADRATADRRAGGGVAPAGPAAPIGPGQGPGGCRPREGPRGPLTDRHGLLTLFASFG